MKKVLNQHSKKGVMFNIAALLCVLSTFLLANAVYAADVAVDALPTNGQVIAGDAHIAAGGTAAAPVLNINQTSQRAVVSWDKFDVGSAATVNFNQPNAQASTLNKITSGSPSKIMGKINAPGEVILVNQSGVYFTPSANLDVGSVVATSHDISNADYMAGKATYDRNGATGKVINEGNIKTALGGYVALLAPEVRNSGVIVAQMGTVVLAAGERITLNFDPSRHLASITATPSAIDALIENRSAVKAPGGLIILSARAVNTLTAGVIKQSGTLSASADANTITNKGGRIYLTANTVKLEAASQTVARGPAGGGEVHVTATQTATVEATAKVSVSATENGNAGTINIHADEKTTINGTLLAQGGNQSGNGGQINTTSHGQVEIGNTAEIKAGVRVTSSTTSSNVGSWNLSATAINISHAVAGVVSQSLNTNNVAIKATVTQLTMDADAIIQKTSPVLTNLSLEAEQSVTIAGQILSSELSPITLQILSQNSVDLQQTSSIQSREVLVAAPNINSVGDVYAYLFGGNNGAIPLISFLASRISVAGNLRAGSNGPAGKISLFGTDEIAITNANISANGDDGGEIQIISMNGTVNLINSVVQTNGGEGRGGAIFLAGLQSTILSGSTLEATGINQGGKILFGYDAKNGTLPFSAYASLDAHSVLNAQALNSSSNLGGFIETSGHVLKQLATINAGRGGMWLIDPYDVTIAASGQSGDAYAASYTATQTTTILASAIVSSLNSGVNVSISTGSNGTALGIIYVNTAISATGSGSLTLNAGSSFIYLGANVTTGGAQKYTGNVLITSAITLTSNNSNITFDNNIYAITNTASLTIDAGTGNVTVSGKVGYDSGAMTAGASTAVLSGGGAGNLDTTGLFVYAAAFGTTTSKTIDDITFVNFGIGTGSTSKNGVTIYNDQAYAAWGGTYSTGNATLESLLQSMVWTSSAGNNAANSNYGGAKLGIDLTGLIPNATYKIQLLSSESCCVNRYWNVDFNNGGLTTNTSNIIFTNFYSSTGVTNTATLASYVFTAANTLANVTLNGLQAGATSPTHDPNAVISAMSLEIQSFAFSSFSVKGGQVSLNGNVTASSSLTINNSLASTISSVLSGAASMTKAGAGTLTLSAANTYTGSTTINAGQLIIERDTPTFTTSGFTGAGTLVVQSAAANFASAYTFNATISNLGGLTIGKTGNTSAVTLPADININGNLLVNAPTTLGANVTTGGTQEYTGNVTLSATNVMLSSMGNSSAGNNITFGGNVNGAIANTHSLYMLSGSGAINVTGSVGNTYALDNFGLGRIRQYTPAGTPTNFTYTGSDQTYTPSTTGIYLVELWGAQGASGHWGAAGLGGYAQGLVSLTSGTSISIYVGSAGTSGDYWSAGSGGWNGGAVGSYIAGGGGGATDIRVGGTALSNRIIVAGGGGGGGVYVAGGVGGGLTGGAGTNGTAQASGGGGGTQSAGGTSTGTYAGSAGSLGSGGAPGNNGRVNYQYAGGGGGGYYGGGGGAANASTNDNGGSGGGGGGGSSYIGGVSSGVTIAGNASMASTSGGSQTGQSGNGYARIRLAESTTFSDGAQTGTVTIGGVVKATNIQTASTNFAIKIGQTVSSGTSSFGANTTLNNIGGFIMGAAANAHNLSVTGSFATAATGTAKFNGGVTTTTTQTYAGPVQLTGDTTFTTTDSAVAFSSTVNGTTANTESLTVAAGTGNTTFTGVVGGTTSLKNISVTTGALTAAAVKADRGITVTNTAASTISGVISGTASLTKAGAGTLTLSGTNTFTGAITVSNGVLAASNSNALGTSAGGVTISDGAQLSLSGGITIADLISVTGSGGGTGAILNTSGNNTISVLVSLSGATTIGSTSGTLTFDVTNGGSNYAISGTQNLTFTGAGNVTVADPIATGTGTLTKSGSGTLTLSGVNTFTGAITVSNGVLAASNNSALGTSAGGVTISDGAQLSLSSGITIADAIGVTGSGNGTGGILNTSGDNKITGLVSLSGATTIGSTSGTLTFDVSSGNAITGTQNLTFTGVGNVTVEDPIATSTGTLTKSDAGTLTLKGLNTYTGITTINGGVLSVSILAAGGSPSGIGQSDNGADKLVIDGGTLKYIGANTSTDRLFTIGANGATIDSSGSQSLTFSNTGSLVVTAASSPTLTLTGTNTVLAKLSSVLADPATSGVLTLIKTGTGTWGLDSANTYTGTTTISSGTLYLLNQNGFGLSTTNVDIRASGALYIGALTVDRKITLAGGTIYGYGTLTGDITLTANSTFYGASTSTPLTVNSLISDAGLGFGINVGVSGYAHKVKLSNANNAYSGATTVNYGTLMFGDANAIPTTSNLIINSNGILDSVGLTISKPITLAGGAITNSVTGGSYTGAITLTANSTLKGSNGPILTIAGAGIGESGGSWSITMSSDTGYGRVLYSVPNTYTGATNIFAAILQLGVDSALDNTSAVYVGSSTIFGTLDLYGHTTSKLITTGTYGTANIINSTGTGEATGGITINSFLNIYAYRGATLRVSGAAITGLNKSVTIGGSCGSSCTNYDGTVIFANSVANTYLGNTSVSYGTLQLGAATANLIPSGTTLTVNAAATFDVAGYSFDGALSIGATGLVMSSVGTTGQLTGGVLLTGTLASISAAANSVLTIKTGSISGSSGTVLFGTATNTGTVVINSATTFTGGMTVSYGKVQVGNAAALGPSTGAGTVIVSSGAVLDLNGQTLTNSGNLSISGTGMASSGALMNSSVTGATYAGSLLLGSAATIVADTGSITFTKIGTTTGAYLLTLDGAQGGSIASVIATAAGGITKAGSGTWTLSAVNTYTGPTTISAGTLQLGTGGSLSSSTQVTMSGSASFDLNGNNLSLSSLTGAANNLIYNSKSGTTSTLNLSGATTTTYAGVIADNTGTGGTIALTRSSSSASAIFTLSGANTYTGGTTISGGVLAISSDGNLGAVPSSFTANAITLSGGELRATASASLDAKRGVTLTAASTLSATTGNTLTVDGIIDGTFGLNINVSTTGTVLLAGANTYSGNTSINYGTLKVGSPTALGSGSASVTGGAVLDLNGQTMTSTGGLTLNGAGISSGGALINSSSSPATYAGLISLGTTAVSIIGDGGTIALTNSGTISGSVILTLGGAQGGSIDSIIDNGASAGLTKKDSGTWTLTGLNTYSGGTTINGGVLSVSVLANGGIASGIGRSSNSINSLIINGGTLKYTGVAASTDRSFKLGPSGGSIDASGTGLLSFTSTAAVGFTTTYISPTLTLTGTGSGSLINKLQDSAGPSYPLSLTKTGSGSWVVNNSSNAYTGNTNINGGILQLGSANPFGSTALVTVNNGGTLDVNNFTFDKAPILSGGTVINSNGQNGALSRGITLTANSTLAAASGATLIVTGTYAITGAYGLTIGSGSNLGKVTLAGKAVTDTNSYTGVTTVSAGATLDLLYDGTPNFRSSYDGAGTIILKPLTSGSNGKVELGASGAALYTLYLSTNLFASGASNKFADGFANIVIGSITGGNLSVTGTAAFMDSVTLLSGGNITINASASVTTSQASGNLVVAATGACSTTPCGFINNSGVNALQTLDSGSADRWIVYTNNPTNAKFGPVGGILASSNKAFWGSTYSSLAPSSIDAGNRYVFNTAGTVTITTTNATMTYGLPIDLSSNYTVSNDSMNAAPTGTPYISNVESDLFTTAPTITSTGNTASAVVGQYDITASSAVAATGFSTLTYTNTGKLTVNPATITLGVVGTKTYDGSAIFNTGLTVSGLANGDELDTATANSANVADNGSNYFVSFTLSSGTASNYVLVSGYNAATNAATINKASAYVLVTAGQSSTYGLTPTINYTFYSNAAGTGGSAISTSTSGTATITNAPTASSNAATYALTYASGLTADNYTFNPASGSVNYVVNKASAYVLVTAGQSSTYGLTPTINYTFYSNAAGTGGSAISTSTSGTATITNAPTATSNAATYALTYASGLTADNYTFNPASGSVNYVVNHAPLVITGATRNLTYNGSAQTNSGGTFAINGGSATAFSGTSLSTGIGSDGFTVAGYGTGTNANAYADNLSATVAGSTVAGNYSITYQNGSLTIDKANAYVLIAANQSSTYGATPTINYSYYSTASGTGGASITSPAGLAGSATITNAPTASSNAATYALTYASGLSSTNYLFNPATSAVDYVVNPATLEITAPHTSVTFNGNLQNNAGGTFKLNGGTATAITNGTVSTGIGSESFDISGYGAGINVSATAYADSLVATEGNGTLASNYTISYQHGSLTINKATIVVDSSNTTTTYDGTAKQNSATATVNGTATPFSSVLGGSFISAPGSSPINSTSIGNYIYLHTGFADDVFAISGAAARTNVGTTADNFALTAVVLMGTLASNYDIVYNNAQLTVNPAPLGVSLSGTYSGSTTIAPTSFQFSGLVNNETVTALTSATVNNANVSSNGANYVTALVSGGGTADLSNYVITTGYHAGSVGTDTNGVFSGSTSGTATNAGGSNTATLNKADAYVLVSSGQSSVYGIAPTTVNYTFNTSAAGNGSAITSPLGLSGTASFTGLPSTTSVVNIYGVNYDTGLSATNYNFNPAASNTNFLVTPAALTITASAQSTIYGTALALGTSAYTSSGLINGDSISGVTLNQGSNTTVPATQNAGTYTGATNGIIASNALGSGLANYDITYTTGTLTINQKALSITANNDTKIYGVTKTYGAGSTAFTVSGLENSEAIGSVTVTDTNSGGLPGANVVGSYALTPSAATGGTFDIANYIVTYNAGTLSVGKATLTYNATATNSTYGSTPSVNAGTITGFVNNETATALTGTLLFSTTATATSNVGSYAITGSGYSSNNYDFVQAAANATALTIGQKALTITANAQISTYGSTLVLGTSAFTNSVLETGDTISSVTLTQGGNTTVPATQGAGVYSGATNGILASAASGTGLGNYLITYLPGTLTINKATLTVTADSQARVYGDVNSTLTYTISGYVNGQNLGSSGVTGAAAISTTATQGSNVGIYTITSAANNLAATNYDFSYTDGTLTVNRRPVTVTADNKSKTYGDVNPVLTYTMAANGVGTSRGLYGADALTGDPATTATQATGVGYPAITQGGLTNTNNGNYAITFNDGTLTINPAQLTVTANADAKFVTQSDVANFNGVNYTGFVNGDTATNLTGVLTVTRTNATENNAGVYTGVLQPAGFSSSNYSITYANGNYTITPAETLLVDVNNQNITYGAAPTFVIDSVKYLDGQNVIHTLTQDSRTGDTYTFSDGVGGSATFTLTTNAGLSSSNHLVVGNYSLLGANFSKVSNNFNNNPVYTGNLAVQQKALTAGTSSVSKVYDGSASMANLNISLNPIVSGDVVTASGQGAFSQAGVGSGLSYSVSNLALTGTDAGNYYLSGGTSFSGNNGEITKAPLGIAVTASYNGITTVTPTAATLTGLVNNETLTVTSVGLNAANVAANTTNYVTSILASSGTASLDNYELNSARNATLATNTTNKVTLNPVVITVTANNQSRVYGATNPTSGAVTLTSGTLYGGDTLSTASLSSAAVSTTAAGQVLSLVPTSQTFTVSDAAQNYTITYVNGTLTVNKAPIGIQVAGTYNGTTTITPSSVTITGLANGETLNPSAVLVNDKNVAANGSNYVTAITPTAGDTAALSNYEFISAYNGASATTTTNAVTINKANLSVTATPSLTGNVYNGSAYAGAYTTTAVNGETFTVTGVATGTNAATYASNLVVTGAALDNYNTPTINNANLVISPKAVTITNAASSSTYDGATSYAGLMNTAGFTNTALVGSDSIASVTQTATVSGSAVTGVAQAGTFVSTPSVAVMGVGLVTNYAFTYQTATNTVAKANLSVTANNATKTYDGLVYTGGNGVTYVGLVGGEQSTVLGGLIAYNGTSQNAINAASYTIIPSGLTSNNYEINYTSGTLTIDQRAITLSANAQSTTYGTALALGTSAYTISTGTLATGDAISAVTLQYNSNATVAATTNANTYASGIVASGATGTGRFNTTNYNITYAAGTLTVNKATLTVTANPQSRLYGDANPSFTQTITGFVNGQILANSDVTGSAYGSTTATAASSIGSYTITASANGLTSNNYQFTTTNGTLTVNPRPITVTADAKTKVYGSANPTLTYTVAADGVGTSRGLYGSDVLSGALSVNANTTTPVGAVEIVQNTVSNTNYAITYVARNLSITPATLNVTGYKTYDGSIVIAGTNLTVTGVNGERFTAGGNANLISKNVQVNQNLADVNGITLTPLGGALVSNYAPLDVANTQFTVYVKAVTLTAPSITKTYDGGYAYTMTTSDLTSMSTQLVGGDTVTAASVSYATNGASQNADKVVNLNSVTISDGNGGANYSVTRASSATSRINPALLTIKAADDAKFVTTQDVVGYMGVYGDGFVNGEGLANLSGALVITRTNASLNAVNMVNNAVRPYAGVLVPSGYTSSNYNITFAAGDYTIIPAQTLLIRVAQTNVTYGDITNVSAPAYSYTAQYLPAVTQQNQNPTPVTLTATAPVNGVYTLIDGASGEANFKITAVNPSYSSTNRLVVGGYDMEESNVTVTGNNFLSMLTVGALTVTPKVISATNLGITGVSKVYDGSAAISGTLLNVNAASSQVLSGDRVDVYATGSYDDANVGTAKSIVVDVSLSTPGSLINDAANYSLSSTRVTGNLGEITQLAQVTWIGGGSSNNWSNASNWLGGAIPTFSIAANVPNVAHVIIPVGANVVYDSASVGNSGSAITNNGTLTFNGANNFTFTDNVSGIGSLSLSGAGTLTLVGNNAYSGGTNINSSSLVIGSVNALGTGTFTSGGGALGLSNGVTLTSLTVNGDVTLRSDMRTTGAQIYNGKLGLARSLSLTASAVTFNDSVGKVGTTYSNYVTNHGSDIYNFAVLADSIFINADVTTYGTQTYGSNTRLTRVIIGDNGRNGTTRVLLSEDPAVTFWGTVDDSVANTHDLIVKSVTYTPNDIPTIDFNGDVGATVMLKSLTAITGLQDTVGVNGASPVFSEIARDSASAIGTIVYRGSVSTGAILAQNAARNRFSNSQLGAAFFSKQIKTYLDSGPVNKVATVVVGSSVFAEKNSNTEFLVPCVKTDKDECLISNN